MACKIIWSLQAREDFREIIFPPYRIIYHVLAAQQVVAIARIWHGARGEPEIPTRLEF
jgi:plasmid stabilization system protein ParE